MIITKDFLDFPVIVSPGSTSSPVRAHAPTRAISKSPSTKIHKNVRQKTVTRDPCYAGSYADFRAPCDPISNCDMINAHSEEPTRYHPLKRSDVATVHDDFSVDFSNDLGVMSDSDKGIEGFDLEFNKEEAELNRCALIDDEAEECNSDVDWETAAEEALDVEYSYEELVDVFGSDLEN